MLNEIANQIQRLLSNGFNAQGADNMLPLNFPFEFEKKPFKNAAVLIMLYQKSDKIYFPLIQRQLYNGVHSGQISLPGGKQEKNEELATTALREAEEEIGIDRSKCELLGKLNDVDIDVTGFNVTPYIGIYKDTPTFTPDPIEVDEILEVCINDLLINENLKITDIDILGKAIPCPYYDLNNKIVWGATGKILAQLKILAAQFM